jgi:hypothetical protein
VSPLRPSIFHRFICSSIHPTIRPSIRLAGILHSNKHALRHSHLYSQIPHYYTFASFRSSLDTCIVLVYTIPLCLPTSYPLPTFYSDVPLFVHPAEYSLLVLPSISSPAAPPHLQQTSLVCFFYITTPTVQNSLLFFLTAPHEVLSNFLGAVAVPVHRFF